MHSYRDLIDRLDIAHPITFTVTFLLASWLMVWRLEALLHRGLEGTALGTLVVPYCSGLGNLVFVYLLWRDHGPAQEIMGQQRHQPDPFARFTRIDLAPPNRVAERQ